MIHPAPFEYFRGLPGHVTREICGIPQISRAKVLKGFRRTQASETARPSQQVMLKNQLVVRTLEAIKDEAEAVEGRSEAQVPINRRVHPLIEAPVEDRSEARVDT